MYLKKLLNLLGSLSYGYTVKHQFSIWQSFHTDTCMIIRSIMHLSQATNERVHEYQYDSVWEQIVSLTAFWSELNFQKPVWEWNCLTGEKFENQSLSVSSWKGCQVKNRSFVWQLRLPFRVQLAQEPNCSREGMFENQDLICIWLRRHTS